MSKKPWEMTKKEFVGEKEMDVASNKMDVPTRNRFKKGQYAIDDWAEDPYVYEMKYVNPNEVDYTEKHTSEKDVLNYDTTKKYIEWFKNGIEPMPITVVFNQTTNKFKATNRRRLLAARVAGVKEIPAWVEIGKHQDLIKKALTENKKVPDKVLAEYPGILKDTKKTGRYEMKDLFASAVMVAKEKKPETGGGRDIMKRLVDKLRTVKKKPGKKDYYTNGWGIVKKWQEKQQNKSPKNNPKDDGFDIMQQVVQHPEPIKKESFEEPKKET